MSQHPQLAKRILMIRPANFGPNPETGASNAFQKSAADEDPRIIANKAVEEFDRAVDSLIRAGIEVMVVDDTAEPTKTDAVFPNNWISCHADGTIVTYPMCAQSRRREVRQDVVQKICDSFVVKNVWPLDKEAVSQRFLEGTGSLVMDHANRIAYACRSPRTDEGLVQRFCQRMNYRPVIFDATDQNQHPIYHTNVMMAVAKSFAVICLQSIADSAQRDRLQKEIDQSGKLVVDIRWEQVEQFAGNMLQLSGSKSQPVVVMSHTARKSLRSDQVAAIKRDSNLLELSIPTIEKYGGGSARCMIAENFLEPAPTQTGSTVAS